MVREGKVGHSSNLKKRVRSKHEGSDDSDEDYVVSDDGNEESDDDAEDYTLSLNECASEEGFRSFDEEDDEEVRTAVRLKREQVSSVRERKIVDRKSLKRKRVSIEEEEDEDYERDEEEVEEEEENEEDDEEFTPDEDEDCLEDEFTSDEEDCLDEEFTPDEEDCLDEEEKLPMKKKKNTRKVSKRGLRKKYPSKHKKKRKKYAVSKKPSRKPRRKKRRLKRKRRVEEYDNDDCGFIDNTPVPRQNSRSNAGRRRKTCVVPSDSDFVSSDDEYTISEEEREQVKEANQIFGSLKTNLRSSSSSKRVQDFEELGHPKKPPRRKGKEKVEEIKVEITKAELIKPICGICLSEENKRRLRGTLNCCSHYFCFTCIMEWSKVESRCPLCKQRFETISKPARSAAGVELKEVVIHIPMRDQVYQPSEEELRSYHDPYENVICSECHQGGDDELMLLCDTCDSSAHTYCVGLGREVPEGNWYCNDCRPVAIGSSGSQVQDSLPDQNIIINDRYNRFAPVVNVGESLESTVGPSPRMPSTPSFVGYSPPRFPSLDIPVVSPVSGAGAPTLTGRRWLHRQIQNLRSMNRMTSMAGRSDEISTTNMGTDFVNSHTDQSRDTTVQQASTQDTGIRNQTDQNKETTVQQAMTQDSGIRHQTVFGERLQDDPSSSLPSRNLFSSMLGNLRREAVQNSSTSTSNTSVNLTLWPELAGIDSNNQHRHCSDGSEDKYLMAKEPLQAMIRSHLKALSNNIDLDDGTYNDIATSAMHTLLAACGLEHTRSEVHVVPPPSDCTHIERMAAEQASLMRDCCMTCFDSFVKDVVKRIMDTRSRQWLSLGL